MKASFTRILNELDNDVFRIKHYCQPKFASNFHFHPECQLNYVISGEGQRVVGDSISVFEREEITFLGPNLPHVWYTDNKASDSSEMAQSMTLFIQVDRLLNILNPFMDMRHIERFFAKAKQGLMFLGENQKILKSLLLRLDAATGLRRIILFMKLLENLTNANQFYFLSSHNYLNTHYQVDNDKIDGLFRHVAENFHREIRLEEVSSMACMTKQAFCRYFKNRTGKSFIQFVNEVRVSRASRQLINGDDLIGNIAYDCGFGSLSNFNKIFKAIKKVTPREYRNQNLRSETHLLNIH